MEMEGEANDRASFPGKQSMPGGGGRIAGARVRLWGLQNCLLSGKRQIVMEELAAGSFWVK